MLTSFTSYIWISLEAFHTRANWPVVLHKTVGIGATVTWVPTHSVDTRLIAWALSVSSASWRYWYNHWKKQNNKL